MQPVSVMQFRRNPTATLLFCCSWLCAGAATAATLEYEAHLSGVPVGTATLIITTDDSAYRIAGNAVAGGVAHLFSNWRSDFTARGRLSAGKPLLLSYAYAEQEKKKHRALRVSDGRVDQVKDGQVRPSHEVPPGTDILTAFFLQGDCWRERRLHTGRFSYRISGRPTSEPDTCHFVISDDDGDRTRVRVRFGEHEGYRVPVRITARSGLLRGSVSLKRAHSSLVVARAEAP